MAADEAARGIEPVLTRFIATELLYDREVAAIEPDQQLLGGLLDSMDVLNLVQFLEQQYGVRVGDDELVPENFATASAIAALVARKLAERDRPVEG